MATRIAINGFGRIGRMIVRALEKDPKKELEIVVINDITDPKTLSHLLKYDSVHGRFQGTVAAAEHAIVVNGKTIQISAERDPAKLPWRQLGIDLVIESTGLFTERDKAKLHLDAGAKKVLISAPAKNPDITLCLGINIDKYDTQKHHIISNASCTTNCLAPMVKVLHEAFGVASGMMTTIHSYTNDQRILDLPHSDLRRARAGALSMIPTTTGAAKALSEVLPEMKGRLDGLAVRVPTPNVSVVDFVARLERPATKDGINDAYRKAAAGPLAGILAVTDEPVVSIDFNGDIHSSTIDLSSTMVTADMAKVFGWYDNETGYANRLYELAKLVARGL